MQRKSVSNANKIMEGISNTKKINETLTRNTADIKQDTLTKLGE